MVNRRNHNTLVLLCLYVYKAVNTGSHLTFFGYRLLKYCVIVSVYEYA
ncbi:hypothetical protein BH23THE1_BH23THE1_23220 [soil metagenome]